LSIDIGVNEQKCVCHVILIFIVMNIYSNLLLIMQWEDDR
jgi:hypothetical protein